MANLVFSAPGSGTITSVAAKTDIKALTAKSFSIGDPSIILDIALNKQL